MKFRNLNVHECYSFEMLLLGNLNFNYDLFFRFQD